MNVILFVIHIIKLAEIHAPEAVSPAGFYDENGIAALYDGSSFWIEALTKEIVFFWRQVIDKVIAILPPPPPTLVTNSSLTKKQ